MDAASHTETLTTRSNPIGLVIGPDCSDLVGMRLSNFADYAIVVMSAAAAHCGGSRSNAGALALETGLPRPTVQKLVSKLTGAGLLRSVRGARGGLQLARPAAAITVADIVEAVEGPIALTPCVDSSGVCDHEGRCSVRAHWPLINETLRDALAAITLDRLAAPPVPVSPVTVSAPAATTPHIVQTPMAEHTA